MSKRRLQPVEGQAWCVELSAYAIIVRVSKELRLDDGRILANETFVLARVLVQATDVICAQKRLCG